MNPKPTLLRRGLLAATVACAALGTAPAHAAISITETDADSFHYATAPGWISMGKVTPPSAPGTWTPHLTANPVGTDPAGDGWLRLTEPVAYQSGMAVYDTAFSSAQGLQITFEYASYGHTSAYGADGITFFLIDGSTASPAPGSTGGSLGYGGMVGAYVGIGLDEYGSFSANCGSSPCTATAQNVTVRGAQSKNFPILVPPVLLSSLGLPPVSTTDPNRLDARTVRITISPASSGAPPTMTVEIDPGTGFVKVIDAFKLTTALNGPIPTTFKFGFGASTGGHNNYHEVRIKNANTLVSAVPALGQSTLGALAVLLTLLTLPALRRQFK
ncbi:MAG: hypothetical protein LBP52_06380 [Burkholderiaceae bacterium]|nr:hypothetical protein [Burkholderiaceae bacterium]